jgi:hypothetical protein
MRRTGTGASSGPTASLTLTFYYDLNNFSKRLAQDERSLNAVNAPETG